MSRKSIDWEPIDRDFLSGKYTVPELSRKYGVAQQTIHKHNREMGLHKGLAAEITERTQEKLRVIGTKALIEEAALANAVDAALDRNKVIESTASLQAAVIDRHRKVLTCLYGMCERASDLYAQFAQQIQESEEIKGADIVRLAQVANYMVQANAKLIDKEREAYGLTSEHDGADETRHITVSFVDP